MFCNSWTSFEKDKDYGKGAVSICGYFGMNAFGFLESLTSTSTLTVMVSNITSILISDWYCERLISLQKYCRLNQ